MKIAPSDNNVIWVAHNCDVEKSADGGKTWIASFAGISICMPPVLGIWGTSATDVFAVGDNGTILHYGGLGFEVKV